MGFRLETLNRQLVEEAKAAKGSLGSAHGRAKLSGSFVGFEL